MELSTHALHCDRKPGLLVVTDIDDARLERAKEIFTDEVAKEAGVDLHFLNTRAEGSEAKLIDMTGGEGFDDVFRNGSGKTRC